MALELIKACRAMGVDCITAPYEADAQLAYLSKTGIAQLVISEDSDLIPFGCEKVLFKMDKVGNGLLVEKRDLKETLPFNQGFTFDRFRWMCILSGKHQD
jgi:exonuclease-1